MKAKKPSAVKRHEQSERRRLHNKAIKSECKTYARNFVEQVQKKDKDAALEALKVLVKKWDSARSKGVLKRNAVSRKKSRMTRLFNNSFLNTASSDKATA